HFCWRRADSKDPTLAATTKTWRGWGTQDSGKVAGFGADARFLHGLDLHIDAAPVFLSGLDGGRIGQEIHVAELAGDSLEDGIHALLIVHLKGGSAGAGTEGGEDLLQLGTSKSLALG